MYKNLFAIAALLGVLDTEAVRVQLHQRLEGDNDTVLQNTLNNEEDLDLRRSAPADTEALLLAESEKTLATSSYSCGAGIARWAGSSNSASTYTSARSAGYKWEDPVFKADRSAIGWPGYYTSYTANDVRDWHKSVTKWERPGAFWGVKNAPKFWGATGGPRPEGISQGSVGDCWFLAGVSALSEVPDRVKNIVQDDDNSGFDHGIFRFYFWSRNKWHGVNIDDRLPAAGQYDGYRQPAMSRAAQSGGEFWLPLMEKAYAKFDQTYERIVGGNGVESLRVLTAMPSTAITFKGVNRDALYTALYGLAKKNHPMTTACCNTDPGYGNLYSGHAYTLLDVFTLSNGQKMAKIRNPHNAERYDGAYNDNDYRWTTALANEVGLTKDKNDGIFYMPFDKYHSTFKMVGVALYQPYAGYKQVEIASTKSSVEFSVTNPIAQELYVVAEGYGNRNFPRVCNNDFARQNFQLVLYDTSGKRVMNFDFSQWLDWGWSQTGRQGWAIGGKINVAVPAGTYRAWFKPSGGVAVDATLHVYWKSQEGTVTKKQSRW